MVYCRFQENPIDINEITQKVGKESDGAVVIFTGQARNKTGEKEVTHLEYQLYHEMAEKELEKILRDASAKWDLTDCAVIHRYGKVLPGQVSIIIGVSSPHRDEAYSASRYIIDTIKKTVPVWKKEFYRDGSSWITKGS